MHLSEYYTDRGGFGIQLLKIKSSFKNLDGHYVKTRIFRISGEKNLKVQKLHSQNGSLIKISITNSD